MKKLILIFLLLVLGTSCKKQEVKPTMLCSVRVTYKDNTTTTILGDMNSNELKQYIGDKYKLVEIYCSNTVIKGNK